MRPDCPRSSESNLVGLPKLVIFDMSSSDPRAVAEQALYKRLVISYFDLTEARQFLNRLLGLNSERVPDQTDRIQRDALMTALVVGYGRPFSGNRPGDTTPRLPERFLNGLTSSQRALHELLLALRNQEFAHSDPEPAGVEVTMHESPDGAVTPYPVSNRTRIGLDETQLRELNSIFTHLLIQIYDEMRRIETVLKPGDTF